MIRIKYIDGLRGMAILCMILAHTYPNDSYEFDKVPFVIRLISSLAAPLFLFLVGFNFNPKHKMNLVLMKKILLTLILAAAVDVFLWEIIPFYSYDILYLIGISIFALIGIGKWSNASQIILILMLIIGALLYQFFGLYALEVHELSFSEFAAFSWGEMFNNMLFNGWFPIFPWMIFPIIGMQYKRNFDAIKSTNLMVVCIPVFVFLVYLESLSPSLKRFLSLELFYPADLFYLGYSIAFVGICMHVFHAINWGKRDFLQLLGKPSLFFYGFHLFFIHLTFDFVDAFFGSILIVFAVYVFFFILCSYLIEFWKVSSFYPENSVLFGFLFGK